MTADLSDVTDDRLEVIAKEIESIQATAISEVAKRIAEAREIFRYRRDEGGFAGWVETRLRFTRQFADTNRHMVEVPDSFAIARWPRDANVATIARCILGTLKYEPHTADTTALRRALECVIAQTQSGAEQ